jgi:hypothetical protein
MEDELPAAVELIVHPEVVEETVMLDPATMNWPFMLVAVRVLSTIELLLTDLVEMSPFELTTKLEPMLIAPKLAPPVTERDVEVPVVKAKEFNWVPPVTESPPREVALAKVEAPEDKDPREVPPLTERPVVVALAKVVLPVTVRNPLWKVPPWTMRPVPPTTLGVQV